MIPLRKLGHSELEVSPIGVGVMQFAGGSGALQSVIPAIPEDDRIKIVKTALEGGINWFDGAEVYGAGRAEKYLAEALGEMNELSQKAIIATKWSSNIRFVSNLNKIVQERIDNLAPYSIGLFQIHNSKSLSSLKAQMNAMIKLFEKGLIRGVGVSNFNTEQMRKAHSALKEMGLGLASNQVQYNLLNREIESNGMVDAARELGISLIASAPLASGILTGKFHKNPEILARTPAARRRRLKDQLISSQELIHILDEIAAKHKAEAAHVALAWLIEQGEDIVAIPNVTRVGHVHECIGAMDLKLSEEDLKKLDQVSSL